jgi:hypothetical protein
MIFQENRRRGRLQAQRVSVGGASFAMVLLLSSASQSQPLREIYDKNAGLIPTFVFFLVILGGIIWMETRSKNK